MPSAPLGKKWHSYSDKSKRYNIIKLIKELIDPSVSEYLSRLPNHYLSFCPASIKNCNYSDLVKLRGFSYTADQIHFHLRNFVNHSSHTEQDMFSYPLRTCSNHFLCIVKETAQKIQS